MFEITSITYVLYWIYSKVVNLNQVLYFVPTLKRKKAQNLLKVILSDVLTHIHCSLDAQQLKSLNQLINKLQVFMAIENNLFISFTMQNFSQKIN